jgi:hypothetical protein
LGVRGHLARRERRQALRRYGEGSWTQTGIGQASRADATLQRLVQMSPHEHEERLRYDSATVLELQLSGWSAEA